MGIHKQQSSNQTQEQTAFTAFQPSFFDTNLVPETFEVYEFEKASISNPTNTIVENEPIPHWSGVTSHSAGVTSYASSTPILNHKQKTRSKITVEKQDHQSIQTRQIVFKERKVKNYQIFPGNTRFLCDGRFVTSKDHRGFLAALLLFITPVILFCIFTCPFLWNEVHPAIPIVFAYLFLIAFSSMLKTSWTDPGIIPRNLDILKDETTNESSSVINSSIISGYVQKNVQIKNTTWFLRYCETCKIYRPPRASHCRQCDNCVVCVILCAFVIAFNVYQLFLISRNNPEGDFGFVFIQAPVSFVLTVYCFILLWMVGGLTVYHCTLIVRGVTTHEQLRSEIMKANYPDLGVNPYNKKNPFKNMAQILCQPQPKSFLRRRKIADTFIENL